MVMGYVNVCPVAARCTATTVNSSQLSTSIRFRNSRNGRNWTRDDVPRDQLQDADDRGEVDGQREVEPQRGPAVRARERVATQHGQQRRERREVGQDRHHSVPENCSWLLTCSFMSFNTFAASSSPLRNSSSVGCTIRLICGALSVIG